MRQRLVVMCDRRVIERNAQRLRDLQGRQLPQTTEQAIGTAAGEDDVVTLTDPYERAREDRELALLLARGHDGQLGLTAVAHRDAVPRDRAHETPRIGRRAQRGTELHEPLVEIARCARVGQRGHQLRGARPQRLRSRRGLDVVGDAEHSREDTRDVSVHERCALSERDARDRTRGVRTDARHLAQLGRATRQRAGPLRGNGLRALL